MAEEKVLTLNLRKIIRSSAAWKRAKKVSRALRKFLEKYAKKKVAIDKKLNERIWQGGGRKPPTRIRLRLKKKGEGFIAELME